MSSFFAARDYGSLEDNLRGYDELRRYVPSHLVPWIHGGGYAVIDSNLLGGNGDGRRRREFDQWHLEVFDEPEGLFFCEEENILSEETTNTVVWAVMDNDEL